MLSGTETETQSGAAHGAEGAEAAFDPGSSILHHILDANELEVFVPTIKIPLPHLEADLPALPA